MAKENKNSGQKNASQLQAFRPLLASAAQKIYDDWQQDEDGQDEELGEGGICQDIASAMSEVLAQEGFDCAEVSAQVGEQHVFVLCRLEDGVYEVDISPYLYESGGGYSWKKLKNIELSAADVSITKLSADPGDFEEMTGE